jgi:hypothetical protein
LWPHFAAISTRLRAGACADVRIWTKLVADSLGEGDARFSRYRKWKRKGAVMFEYRDLFRWDRFITPTLIKPFFGVMIGFVVLVGLSGIFSGLTAMAINPFGGFIIVVASIVGVVAGIMLSRVIAEFVLIAFRINEHLGAIRDQGEMR